MLSNITGHLVDTLGANRAALLQFVPLSTPVSASPDLISSLTVKALSATDGTFSVSLREGDYTVTINDGDAFTISCPEDGGDFDILELIVGSIVYNPSTVGDYALLKGNNLSDVANVATARNNLDVYSRAEVLAKIFPASVELDSTAGFADIDCSLANTFFWAMDDDTEFTIFNIQDGQTIVVRLYNDVGFAAIFGNASSLAMQWTGGTPPTPSSGATDVYTFVRIGDVISASVLQNMQ